MLFLSWGDGRISSGVRSTSWAIHWHRMRLSPVSRLRSKCYSCKPQREFPNPVGCVVDDQACLQVALSEVGPGRLNHAIDTEASLFLNLHDLQESDLTLRNGRIAFRQSAHAACVLHRNGAAKVSRRDVLSRSQRQSQPRRSSTHNGWRDRATLDSITWMPVRP